MAEKKSYFFPALLAIASFPLCCTYVYATAPDDSTEDALTANSNHDGPGFVSRIRALIGKYGWTTQQVCVRTLPSAPGTQAINPTPPNQLNVPAEIVSMAGVGTATFYANGTLHIDAGSSADAIAQDKVAAGDAPLTVGLAPVCDGTYFLDSTNRATVNWNCSISTPEPGLVIAAGPVNWDGFAADGGNTLDLNLKGTLQTLTFNLNGAAIQEQQRLCIQRFVFHKLPG
jgi:hypothetical protein